MKIYGGFDFIHFWSVTLVSTIKTTSFTPPSVIKLYLYVYTPLHVSVLSNHPATGRLNQHI
jgi:hypothetical protein